jgi:hypothetical protein
MQSLPSGLWAWVVLLFTALRKQSRARDRAKQNPRQSKQLAKQESYALFQDKTLPSNALAVVCLIHCAIYSHELNDCPTNGDKCES